MPPCRRVICTSRRALRNPLHLDTEREVIGWRPQASRAALRLRPECTITGRGVRGAVGCDNIVPILHKTHNGA